MLKKRPCRICRRWFRPDPRAGDRQRVCSSRDCQRERHRRSSRDWRARNPDYDRDRRLREWLVREPADDGAPLGSTPLARLDRDAAQDAVGLQVLVFTEEVLRLCALYMQAAVRAEVVKIMRRSPRLALVRPQDATDLARPPP